MPRLKVLISEPLPLLEEDMRKYALRTFVLLGVIYLPFPKCVVVDKIGTWLSLFCECE